MSTKIPALALQNQVVRDIEPCRSVVTDLLKDRCAFILRVKKCEKSLTVGSYLPIT